MGGAQVAEGPDHRGSFQQLSCKLALGRLKIYTGTYHTSPTPQPRTVALVIVLATFISTVYQVPG